MLGFGAISESPLAALPDSLTVSSLTPVHFGTPAVKQKAVTGFMPVSFGPVGTAQRFVSGFAPVSFGAPLIAGLYPVAGSLVTSFGTTTLEQDVAGFRAANFGTPSLTLYVQGFAPVHFGTPGPITYGYDVTALRPLRFGTPAVASNELLDVSGWLAAQFPLVPIVPIVIAPGANHWTGRVGRLRPVVFGQPVLFGATVPEEEVSICGC